MANTKISGLTSATTPLDGTEVLPIVQSSTTKKVANNDLRPKQIQSNATSGVLQVAGPAAGTTRVMTTPNANFTAARTDAAQTFSGVQSFSDTTGFTYSTNSWTASQFVGTIGTGGSWVVYTPSLNSSYGSAFAVDGSYNSGTYTSTINLYAAGVKSGGPYNSQMDIYTSAAGSLTSKFRFDGTGNLLPLGASKGINFTANSAATGMTSQLLNWYEEGTWTPTISGDSTAGTQTYTWQYGAYTRIGRQVTCTASVRIATTSGMAGSLVIGGLPFTSRSGDRIAGSVHLAIWGNLTAGQVYIAGYVSPASTTATLTGSTGATGNLTGLAVSTFAAGSYIDAVITYMT